MENALMIQGERELSIEQVRYQVGKIQELMNSIMKKDEHYGVIPGCEKPSLYKAGAEKLGFTFRLIPKYDIKRTDLPNNHREYEITCSLYHQVTSVFVGQGVGSASTMESKHRYRHEKNEEETEKMVPSGYWELKKTDFRAAQKLLGGDGFRPKKRYGRWMIVRTSSGEKIENPDIADCYNTVLKMAKKRAHVDAMITACAASDIFTQDIEDFPSMESESSGKKEPEQPSDKNTDNTVAHSIREYYEHAVIGLGTLLDGKQIDQDGYDVELFELKRILKADDKELMRKEYLRLKKKYTDHLPNDQKIETAETIWELCIKKIDQMFNEKLIDEIHQNNEIEHLQPKKGNIVELKSWLENLEAGYKKLKEMKNETVSQPEIF